ncbi:unnamed protein product [Leptidea sinapis]|uniref:Uncharacterized protein n=1 Tax=Leptidea sinapis TaxID=189913 RepID=A0A5E4R2E3_9NEOP|nr:unnamed protein product [Leptidea sinapis]
MFAKLKWQLSTRLTDDPVKITGVGTIVLALRKWTSSVVVDGYCSNPNPVNAVVPQGCVLSPTAWLTPSGNRDQCREKLKVAEWGKLNLIQFNLQKTQVCAFTTKKNPISSPSIGILGLEISSDCQSHGHLEGKAKLASKKLGVINRARQSGHTWSIAYQLDPLDCVQRRAALIVGDSVLSERLDHLVLRRDIASLSSTAFITECSEELFHLIPGEFHLRTTRHKFIIPIMDVSALKKIKEAQLVNFLGAFFHVLQGCGMNFLLRSRILFLREGNAPVIPLVLQENVGGGGHLTPDSIADDIYKERAGLSREMVGRN